MKIALITTTNHNVGDDFVREGIKYILKSLFKTDKLEFHNIHKHSPITARNGFEWLRDNRIGQILDRIMPLFLTKDKILEADLIIQSGAPAYWCHPNTHCYMNEWYTPLIKRRWLKYNSQAPLLNIAAGSCQKYFSEGDEFCDSCNQYIREFYNLASITTVRDKLAQKILGHLGIDVPVLPCTSIFAVDEFRIQKEEPEYFVVNYMEGGGHYTFGQNINIKKYENEFRKFYFKVKKYENIIFACHNEKEVKLAYKIDPEAKVFYSKNFLDYLKFYSRAKFGIMNRVHGAFIIASFGRPCVIIGTDSRARMGEEINLRSYFVNDISYEILLKEYESLIELYNDFKDDFNIIKEKAFDGYMEALVPLLELIRI